MKREEKPLFEQSGKGFFGFKKLSYICVLIIKNSKNKMRTHTFKLTCGVECEIKELTGKEQRLLTEQGKKLGVGFDNMLKSIIVRIGSETAIGDDIISRLLAPDRKLILFEARQFSLDNEPMFKFDYPYTTRSGVKATHELEIDVSEGVPTKPLMVNDGNGGLMEAAYKEYSEIEMHDTFQLPKSGKRVVWTLLNGAGERSLLTIKKEERSSHSMLKARNVREYVASKNGEVLVSCDLDSLGLKDIEALRTRISKVEASVDTSLIFEHPEAEYKRGEEKEVTVDMTATVAFFFPSGAI